MSFTTEQIEELHVLMNFNLNSNMKGIKVHKSARQEMIAAVDRLHAKGMITQIDGGYLTDLGREAAEHAQVLLTMLAPSGEMSS
ncbi:MAG: TIGR02647 family protein [Gammaproteobacteria bacterium]